MNTENVILNIVELLRDIYQNAEMITYKECYNGVIQEGELKMSTKAEILKLIQELQDNVTTEDILYKLYVRAKIEEGMKEIEDGQGISQEEAMERISKWLN